MNSTITHAYLHRSGACRILSFQDHKRKIAAAQWIHQRLFSSVTPPKLSSSSKDNNNVVGSKYSKPFITDEGVKIFQADPNNVTSGHGLTWGSVLWPSGMCLAKYLHWKNKQSTQEDDSNKDDDSDLIINHNTRVLELGCGTGVVGLTCAKLGAKHVTLSDSASELWQILRKSIEENELSDDSSVDIYNLDWRDPSTFLDPSNRNNHRDNRYYDLIVAADVLYAGMDGLFARALASHIPSSVEINGEQPPVAIIACPFRNDSPLLNFFGMMKRLGLELDRLEDVNGNAAGASPTNASIEFKASVAFNKTSFVPLHEDQSRWKHIATDPTFSSLNHDGVQIFRVRRVSGTSADARAIRRVGRI